MFDIINKSKTIKKWYFLPTYRTTITNTYRMFQTFFMKFMLTWCLSIHF